MKQAEQTWPLMGLCAADCRPPDGADDHRLRRLLHLHLLPHHHPGHLRRSVVSNPHLSAFHPTVLTTRNSARPLSSSVSTIRNQRYHIHANLSFTILVAEILLLISARFDPGTVGTASPEEALVGSVVVVVVVVAVAMAADGCRPISFPVRSWPSCFISSS